MDARHTEMAPLVNPIKSELAGVLRLLDDVRDCEALVIQPARGD
jgi:hypothetical protein